MIRDPRSRRQKNAARARSHPGPRFTVQDPDPWSMHRGYWSPGARGTPLYPWVYNRGPWSKFLRLMDLNLFTF